MATMAATEKDTPIAFYCRNTVSKLSGMSVDYNEKQKPGVQCTQVGTPVITDPNKIVGFVYLRVAQRSTGEVKTFGGFR